MLTQSTLVAAIIVGYIVLCFYNESIAVNASVLLVLPLCFAMYYPSVHKGNRFVFAFFSVAQFTYLLQELCKCAQSFFGFNDIALICVIIILDIAFAYVSYNWHNNFTDMIAVLQSGWGYLAAVSVLMFVGIYVLTNYPTAIAQRNVYYLTLLEFTATDIAVYCVIHSLLTARCSNKRLVHDEDYLHAQLALKNSQLEVQKLYYKLANTDAMTQLANRAAYEQNSQAAKANWEQLMPAVCFSCDLNNLKSANDSFGHAQGDEIICATADILRETFADTPEVYRMGGDEFVIMGYRISKEDAEARLIRLMSRIAKYNQMHSEAKDKIDLAVGLAYIDNAKTSFDELVRLADDKMYEDKCNKRR